jgi:3-oxoadipate enol-lactonase
MPTVNIDGTKIYYEQVDASPYWETPKSPVLFIHGLSTDHTIWERQVAAFMKERPVLAVDVRGHGRSAKPPGDVYEIADHTRDMLGLLRHLGYTRTHVVGVSMGGMIAQQMALNSPDLIASISLVCTSCEPPKEGATLEWRLGVFDKAPDLAGYYTPVLDRGLGKNMPQPLRDYMYQLAVHNSRDIQRTGMIATFSYDARERVGDIKVPTLVIGGAEDGSIPPHLSKQLASLIPGAKLEILPGSGHGPYFEAPEALNSALMTFIASQKG